ALDWSRAELLVGASDPRGAQSDGSITAGGKAYSLGPGSVLSSLYVDVQQGNDLPLSFFGTPAATIANPDAKFDVNASLKFTGAQRLALLAFGKTTAVSMKGDWPHPSFNGGVLPGTQNLTGTGFEASWTI